jgi:lipopolysaccharide transport system permease protein
VNIFIDHANQLKKVAFPRISLPLIVVGVALVDNLMLLLAILIILGLLGHWPDRQMLWLPLLIALNLGLALGLGLILGTLNVFIRDIGQALPVALQLAFWFTPIVYPFDILPELVRAALHLNPLVPLITAYQDVMVFARPPNPIALLALAVLAGALLALALALFRRAQADITDAL